MTRMLGLLALTALIAVTVLDLAPPAPRTATGGFSASRAFSQVQAIARAPHPTGSAEHDRVRDHLVTQLRGLGLDTRVQEGVGVLPLDYDGVTPMGTVRNVVAVRPGTNPTGRVVLAAHYDSAPGAPGASDDGAGVATLLEVARALPDRLRNDVVFLFTDGEEPGLLGAEAFTGQDPLAKGTVVVLNHEARGNRGTVQMFRTSAGSSPLIGVYRAAAPHPSADSAFASLMSVLPNNTDFHVFSRAGWLGLDSAYVGGGAYYHSPLDDPAHLDQGSLQQMGDNTLAVTRALGGTDLAGLRTDAESIYFTVPGLLVTYPAWLELPIAVAALAVVLVLVFALRRRGLVTWPRAIAAAGLSPVPVLVAAAAGFGLMPLLGVLRPDYALMFTGDPYRPWLYQAGLLVLVAAIMLVWHLAARRLSPRPSTPPAPSDLTAPSAPSDLTAPSAPSDLTGSAATGRVGPANGWGMTTPAVGGLLLVALLAVLSAIALPGGSHALAWPALFAALGWLVSLRLRKGGGVALTVGLAPAAVLLGGTAVTSLDIGLSIGGAIAAAQFALLMLLLPPLFRGRLRWTPVAAAALAVALVAGGLAVDRFDDEHPRQEHLAYAMDEATGQAVWGRLGGPSSPDSRRFFGEDGWSSRPARTAPLRAPALAVLKDDTSGGRRTLALRLTPTGGAPITGLSVESGLARITVMGRDLGRRAGFAFHVPPRSGLEVTLVLPPGRARIRVFEQAHDLSVVPGYERPAGTVHMRPLTTVFRTHTP